MPTDLHELPKLRDGLSFLYIEHSRVEKDSHAIAVLSEQGRVPVPAAALSALMLGPGTVITHDAVKVLAENGCSIIWCGEGVTRCYAQGIGETRKADKVLRQATLHADPDAHTQVVMRMYRIRFRQKLPADLTLEQIRGMEGVRVRETYAKAAKEYDVPWLGRRYERDRWYSADPVNRALSTASSCLNGLCHAGIVSAGYSTALGFLHTGKQLSFVYDIADLYKMDVVVPAAFLAASRGVSGLESEVRRICREVFERERLLDRIVPDIERVLDVDDRSLWDQGADPDADSGLPGGLWDPEQGALPGGVNYGGDDPGEGPEESEG